jgi:tRNA dimethylallyltransferase
MANILAMIGPTASGKSALAMAVARRTGAEILSVDAMQVYQGMNIGTAKPTVTEQREIRHYLLDWVRPDETFSVARFAALAEEVIADAARRGVPLIAVGGTPLYFKALFYGLFDGPSADTAVRNRLGELSGQELHERLAKVDPAAAARIHPADRKRLIRALEVFELTGHPISSLQTEWESAARLGAVWIGLRWETPALNRRINARVKEMMAAGWVEEVRELTRHRLEFSQTASAATGYQELIRNLADGLPLEEAAERIKIATRQLARRQMKWFKRFPLVHWLDGARPLEENIEETLRLWPIKADA